jgi:hypothetical protein
MNAFEIPNLRFSLIAHEAIVPNRFVTANASGEAALSGVGEAAIGVSTNQTATGEICEIADGIVIVEATAVAIAAGATVQAAASGKAVVRTTGVPLGVAITGCDASGFLTVKVPCVAGVDGAAADLQIVRHQVENLAAGADIADIPVFVVPTGYTATLVSATLLSQGTPAGIDAGNTCAVNIEVGATSMAAKTFSNLVVFPTSDAAALTLTADLTATTGQVVTASVTNGATADPPAFLLQLVLSLAKN